MRLLRIIWLHCWYNSHPDGIPNHDKSSRIQAKITKPAPHTHSHSLARARIPYLSCIAMISRWNRQRHLGGVGRIFVSVLRFPHKRKVVRLTVRTTNKEKIRPKTPETPWFLVRVLTWRDPLSAQSCGILSVILLRSYFGINMAMFLLCTTVSTTGYVVHNST